jgi:hypothetical protein
VARSFRADATCCFRPARFSEGVERGRYSGGALFISSGGATSGLPGSLGCSIAASHIPSGLLQDQAIRGSASRRLEQLLEVLRDGTDPLFPPLRLFLRRIPFSFRFGWFPWKRTALRSQITLPSVLVFEKTIRRFLHFSI